MPAFPDFPEEEFRDRLSKAQKILREHNLDALLLSSFENVYYMSGFHSASFWATKGWPYALIVTKDGKMSLVARGGNGEVIARGTSWVSDIHGYKMISHANEAIRQTLADMGLKGAKVGAELGEIQAVRFSTGLFLDLVNSGGVDFVDGSKAIWDMRIIKSKLEVDRIRQAARIASRAAQRAFPKFRAGMTERDAARLLGQYMMEEGADYPAFLIVQSGEKFAMGLQGTFPSESKMKRGDFVMVDFGATYRHYTSDLNRMVIMGKKPPSALSDHYDLYIEANKKGTSAIKPGATAASVYTAMATVFEEAGVKVDAIRLGHGLGLEHEPPHLGPFDQTILKPGMVFAIEPSGIPNKDGVAFNCEDDVTCTENGVERLTTIKREFFIV